MWARPARDTLGAMRRTLLITLISAASLAAVAAVPTAASAEPIIAVDIQATHKVGWDYQDAAYPDECKNWSRGSGSQVFTVQTNRRQRMRLEKVLGNHMLTGLKDGTYEGTVERRGNWRVNVPPNKQPCSPCGPSSEYGPCDPDPKPTPPLTFKCGEKPAQDPLATISYRNLGKIPSIEDGLIAKIWAQKTITFPECPPNLPRGVSSSGASLQTPWPEWEQLPRADTNRILRLQPGDSVTAEVTRQRSFVRQDGKTTKGDRCVSAPDVTNGYGECAITEYRVTFTRVD
jgi:hypothetical protein